MRTKEQRIYQREWARKKFGRTKESLSKSCTWKGRRAEILTQSVLIGSIDNNSDGLNKDYDLLWNGFKVDVKSCNCYKRKNYFSGQWVFNKNKGISDYYFCICMEENIPIKYYLVPANDFGKGITICTKSKFDKYLVWKK